MNEIYIVPVGEIPRDWIETAMDCVSDVFGPGGVPMNCVPVPDDAFDAKRRQYSAPAILQGVLRLLPHDRARCLALAACDLFIPMLTFLFGQAQLGGRAALVSGARLSPQFWGLPADPPRVKARLRKEILHELGHTFGLVHCGDKRCAMSLSTSVSQVDLKEDAFCGACRVLIEEKLSLDRLEGVS